MLAEKRPLRRLRDDDSKLAAAKADRSIFTNAVAAVTKKARGLEAPFACADAIGAAIDLPFDEGLKKEREGFMKLVVGDQSKAQRYAFFAEREAAKVDGVPDGTKPRPVSSVAIIGAGTMGGGIAMSFANAGIPVTLIETGEEQLEARPRHHAEELRSHRRARRHSGRCAGQAHGPDQRRGRPRDTSRTPT